MTFFKAPTILTQDSLSPEEQGWMFKPKKAKERFMVDAQIQELGKPLDSNGVKEVSYWHGMWGHTREYKWKGFLQIPLSAGADDEAMSLLKSIEVNL